MGKYVKGRICEDPECTRVVRSHGLCRVHYEQKKKDGTLRPSAVAVYHGMGKSSEYSSWRAMKAKCHRKTDRYYPKFGGRGIKVCDAWRDSFDAFYKDMGKKPEFPGYKGTTIHRIDPDKDFEPGNCEWATHKNSLSRNGINREERKKREKEKEAEFEAARKAALRTKGEIPKTEGVNYDKIDRLWRVQWNKRYIGSFPTYERAVSARDKAKLGERNACSAY